MMSAFQLPAALHATLREFGHIALDPRGEATLTVEREQSSEILALLHSRDDLLYDQLIDLCGVDYGAFGATEWETLRASERGFSRGVDRDSVVNVTPRRFAVVYQLLSLQRNRRLMVKVFAGGDPPCVDSVTGVWAAANWYEREAFDLYGIVFAGHPDLRRLLTDYGFLGHPFRKDFPLSGYVAMRYDPAERRVVYGPLEIEPRILVPRVVRRDSRHVDITEPPNA